LPDGFHPVFLSSLSLEPAIRFGLWARAAFNPPPWTRPAPMRGLVCVADSILIYREVKAYRNRQGG
jgi:hypothetical protein